MALTETYPKKIQKLLKLIQNRTFSRYLQGTLKRIVIGLYEGDGDISQDLTRKQAYGYTIYEQAFFPDLDGLTATGFTPTFNNLTGSIVLANGASNNTKYIQVGDYATADLGKELYVKYKVLDLSGYGIRIGHVYNAGYNLATNSIDLFLNGNVSASMPSAITVAVGDIIELTVTQKGFKYFIKVSINNKEQVFEVNPNSPNGLGLFRIFNVGGNIEISRIRYASNSQRDPYIITLGDSKTSANDYASYLTDLGPTSTHGANGASTADIVPYCDRIFAYVKPKYVILNIGRNDIAYNIPLETTENNYRIIVAKCEAIGAKVIHLLPIPESTAIDQTALTAFIKANYVDWVDVSPIWNLATDVYDTIHPADLGARKLAFSVIESNLIPKSSNYQPSVDYIKSGSILPVSITGSSGTTSAVSGTTGYLSKFISATKIAISSLFETATGVGIGTLTPQTPLHINKNVPYQLRLENSGQYYDFGRDSATGFLAIYGNQAGFNGYIFKGVDRTFLTLLNNGNATLVGILTAKNLKGTDLAGTGTRLLAALPDGTLTISSVIYQDVSLKAQPNGYASLDANGKIPNAQIPPLAISDTFPVASQTEMLALTAEQGDVAIRSDISKSFILQQSPASTLANWKELLTPTDAVQSINGKVGVVSLTLQDVVSAGSEVIGKIQVDTAPTNPTDVVRLGDLSSYAKVGGNATTGVLNIGTTTGQDFGFIRNNFQSFILKSDELALITKLTLRGSFINITDFNDATKKIEIYPPTTITGNYRKTLSNKTGIIADVQDIDDRVSSGEYTPTFTQSTGGEPANTITHKKAYWTKVGDMVTVQGYLYFAGVTQSVNQGFSMSLPIPSNVSFNFELIGIVQTKNGSNLWDLPPTEVNSGVNGVNGVAWITFGIGSNVSLRDISYQYTYKIIA